MSNNPAFVASEHLEQALHLLQVLADAISGDNDMPRFNQIRLAMEKLHEAQQALTPQSE